VPDDYRVEFLDEDGAPVEVLTGRPRHLLTRRGPRWAAVGLVVVAVAGVLVARTAAQHHGQDHPAVHPTTPAPPTRVIRFQPLPPGTSAAVIDGVLVPLPAGRDCPRVQGVDCDLSDQVSATMVAAVRTALHLRTIRSQRAIDLAGPDHGLDHGDTVPWYRELVGTGPGHTTISVVLAWGVPDDEGTLVGSSSLGVTATARGLAGPPAMQVTVTMTGPPGWSPPIAAMRALAVNRELVG
jgi:hypothetical protein